MHIAFLAPGWPLEAHPNGIVTYVHWMREELRLQGHRVSVLTGRLGKKEDGVREVRDTLRLRAHRWLARRRGIAEPYPFAWGEVLADDLLRLHRTAPIDVIEMEESFGWAGTVGRKVPVPLVVKLHGPAFLSLVEEQLASESARLRVDREGDALRQVRVITAPSRVTLERTLQHYALAPKIARHVVNPISLSSDTPLWVPEKCEPRTILFVGRFDKTKGADRVLLAFKELLRERSDLKLIFAGPDNGLSSSNGRVMKFADYAAGIFTATELPRIEYLGSLPALAISKLRCRAAVTIVASRWETQGYTALEAMLQCCPLVCANNSGLSELVENDVTGLLFDDAHIEDMVRKISYLLDNIEIAAQLGRTAHRRALEAYSGKAVAAQALDVYEDARRDYASIRRHESQRR